MPNLSPEILWEEGTLLRPQHLQAFQRHCQGLLSRLLATRPFTYGVRNLKIRAESVGNWLLEVAECDVLMPDGSVVVAGETARIDAVEFSHLKLDAPRLDVWLAVPLRRETSPNVYFEGGDQRADGAEFGAASHRYVAAARTDPDENTGTRPHEYGVKLLNGRLFVGHRPPPGHSLLKIAELEKVVTDDSAGRRYELSEDYAPASLSIDSSPALHSIVRDLLDRLERKSVELLGQIGGRRDLLGADAIDSPGTLIKLQATNGVLPMLRQLVGQPGMHPFDVYLQLTRLIGDLSIFADNWEPPKLVIYDHDDPLPAFRDLKAKWGELLAQAIRPTDAKREFTWDEGEGLQGAKVLEVPESWLAAGVVLHLGIRTAEPLEAVGSMFSRNQAVLTAPEDLRDIQRQGIDGIACSPDAEPPPSLRLRSGHVFLRVHAEGELWDTVRRARKLAVAGPFEEVPVFLFASNLNH